MSGNFAIIRACKKAGITMENQKFTLTQEGLEKLQNELSRLINTDRPQVIEDLGAARAQGDLSENADYDAARSRQAEVEGRIQQIENILANSTVVESSTNNDIVSLGCTVTILDQSENAQYIYKLVGTIEAKPLEGSISTTCPLGEAILGKGVGDVCVVKTEPPYNVEILKIKIGD